MGFLAQTSLGCCTSQGAVQLPATRRVTPASSSITLHTVISPPPLPEFEIALHRAKGKLPGAVKLLEDQLIESVSLKY